MRENIKTIREESKLTRSLIGRLPGQSKVKPNVDVRAQKNLMTNSLNIEEGSNRFGNFLGNLRKYNQKQKLNKDNDTWSKYVVAQPDEKHLFHFPR